MGIWEKSEAKFHFLRSFQQPSTFKFAMRPRGPQVDVIQPRKPTTLRKKRKASAKFSDLAKSFYGAFSFRPRNPITLRKKGLINAISPFFQLLLDNESLPCGNPALPYGND
ncbi:MAG: hypothetical protein SOR93_08985 [Clostridiales Family XIII bacterium]|uniref:hypothetical protein n=1 Tax=Hominibacterium faecale TaxID=2839743 RepID=UPI0022B29EEE|nr:hypothetical protein [Hominibacterium faecale]MDE8733686.1 hypothetical protein [Eubacteriales bacterium DFI.9.88]MDY3011368.1 hypothetical protein [Clostridiales Family XIII bacterium]